MNLFKDKPKLSDDEQWQKAQVNTANRILNQHKEQNKRPKSNKKTK